MQNLSYENEFHLHLNENSFSYERLCIKTRFERGTRQLGNGLLKSDFFSNAPAWGIPRRLSWREDIELQGRMGAFFTFLTCYLFSTCEFLFLCYISARHLTYKPLKLNKVSVI